MEDVRAQALNLAPQFKPCAQRADRSPTPNFNPIHEDAGLNKFAFNRPPS